MENPGADQKKDGISHSLFAFLLSTTALHLLTRAPLSAGEIIKMQGGGCKGP